MTTTLQKWGNSLGVRIEKGLARKQGLLIGSRVKVTASKRGVLIERAPQAKKSLSELVRDITVRNIHREEDWGAVQGNEIW